MPKATICIADKDGEQRTNIAQLEYDPLHLDALVVQVEALAAGWVADGSAHRIIAISGSGAKLVDIHVLNMKDVGEL